MYLVPRLCLCDVIPSNSYLAGRRKTYNSNLQPLQGQQLFPCDYPIHHLNCDHFQSLEHVWFQVIWLNSGHNSRVAFQKPFGQNLLDGTIPQKMWPGRWILFKMVAMTSNMSFFRDKFHKENLHYRG